MASFPRPDAAPQADEAYARKRLGQLVAAHMLAGIPTPGPGGLAAVWRGLSGTLGAPAAAAGYGDPGFWLRQGAPTGFPGPPLISDNGGGGTFPGAGATAGVFPGAGATQGQFPGMPGSPQFPGGGVPASFPPQLPAAAAPVRPGPGGGGPAAGGGGTGSMEFPVHVKGFTDAQVYAAAQAANPGGGQTPHMLMQEGTTEMRNGVPGVYVKYSDPRGGTNTIWVPLTPATTAAGLAPSAGSPGSSGGGGGGSVPAGLQQLGMLIASILRQGGGQSQGAGFRPPSYPR